MTWNFLPLCLFLLLLVQGCGKPAMPAVVYAPGEVRSNSLDAKLAWVPPGHFKMGTPREEKPPLSELPVHRVEISRGFWIGVHEVTQREYEVIAGENPSHEKGPDLPVDQVTWHQAVEFCQRLTERERSAGRLSPEQLYRLPSEAEWEYSARAGWEESRYDVLDEISWHVGNSGGYLEWDAPGKPKPLDRMRVHPVGKKQPNDWGLYDMIGNVTEWCLDWPCPYPGGLEAGVQELKAKRVTRGGKFNSFKNMHRVNARFWNEPDRKEKGLGFRIVLDRIETKATSSWLRE